MKKGKTGIRKLSSGDDLLWLHETVYSVHYGGDSVCLNDTWYTGPWFDQYYVTLVIVHISELFYYLMCLHSENVCNNEVHRIFFRTGTLLPVISALFCSIMNLYNCIDTT